MGLSDYVTDEEADSVVMPWERARGCDPGCPARAGVVDRQYRNLRALEAHARLLGTRLREARTLIDMLEARRDQLVAYLEAEVDEHHPENGPTEQQVADLVDVIRHEPRAWTTWPELARAILTAQQAHPRKDTP